MIFSLIKYTKKSGLIILLAALPSILIRAQKFVDVTTQAGIQHQYKPYEGTFGGGACILDINNDGYEDIFLTGGQNEDALYLNVKNGTFKNIFASSGLKLSTKYITSGAVSADINKDGLVDLFITTITKAGSADKIPRAENLLFLNTGNNQFKDATKQFGLDEFSTFSTGAAFGDINADGYPDLFVSNYFQDYSGQINIMNESMIVGSGKSGKPLLFINKKGKYFEECSEKYNLKERGFGFGGSFTDVDNDNNLDLIVFNDFGYKAMPNKVYHNNYPDNSFTEVSDKINLNLGINAMGLAIGDFNNDGYLDYFFSNIRSNQLLQNQGNKKPFINQSTGKGIAYPFSADSLGRYITISWGCNFGDFDNDGDLDLFVANGCFNPNVEPNPDNYFENVNGQFSNKSFAAGLDNSGIGRGSVIFDYDNDGDLDLLVVNQKPVYPGFEKTDAYTTLYKNETAGKNWIKVSLSGKESDTKGLGAKIFLYCRNKIMVRETDGGSSHLSQSTIVAHFGLDTITTIDSIKTTWPGGKKQVVKNPTTNQLLIINEISSPEKRYPVFKYTLLFSLLVIAIALISFRIKKNITPSVSSR